MCRCLSLCICMYGSSQSTQPFSKHCACCFFRLTCISTRLIILNETGVCVCLCVCIFFSFFFPHSLSLSLSLIALFGPCICIYFSFIRPQNPHFLWGWFWLKLLQTNALTTVCVCMAYEKRQSFWLCWRLWNPSLRCQLDMKCSLLFIIHIISKTSLTIFFFIHAPFLSFFEWFFSHSNSQSVSFQFSFCPASHSKR